MLDVRLLSKNNDIGITNDAYVLSVDGDW